MRTPSSVLWVFVVAGALSEKLLHPPDTSPDIRGVSGSTGVSFFQKKYSDRVQLARIMVAHKSTEDVKNR